MKLGPDTSIVEPKTVRHRARSKVRLLTRQSLDGRTRASKLFGEIVGGIETDLGGRDRLTTVERSLVEAFGGAAVLVNALNARLLLGQQVDLAEYSTVVSTLVRTASRIGVTRRPRDVTPSLDEYLRSHETEEEPAG
jgi:hypothetical protein